MTNDEAIYVLKNTAWLGWDKQKEKVTEAVQMAVEALKRETSGDAIDRQVVIDTLCDWICGVGERCVKTQQPEERTEERTETHACDCISRLGAIDICNNVIDLWQGQLGEGALVAIKNAINNLPSVQPDIIHCKDCKHSEHWYRDKSRCFLWHEEGIDVFEDGFCNYAERRTDETD